MKPINILLTCSSFHAVGIIDCLKNNPDNVPVNVYVTNCSFYDLPPSECCDGTFVVPMVYDDTYIQTLLNICYEKDIDIIFPTSSLELERMAQYENYFTEHGIKVSVSNLESIIIAGDKVKSGEMFSQFMPRQAIANNAYDVLEFSRQVKDICCKPINLCGGKGFAVVDEEKSSDVSFFHAYGKKHYITLWQLCKAVEKCPYPMLLQEYHYGNDYVAGAMAVNGTMTHFACCHATKLEFGATVEGEIVNSPECAKIASNVIKSLGIDGNVGFDFIVKDDGTVILVDINLRVNATVQFYAKAGLNLPWLRVKQLIGEDIYLYKPEIDYGLKVVKYFSAHYFHC